VQPFQRTGIALPPVGRILVLIANEGQSAKVRQHVRVIAVEALEQTFTYSTGSDFPGFPALVVTCELSDALRYDFAGSPRSRLFARSAGKTLVRETRVTDTARYFGVPPLVRAAALGELQAKAQ
jgi:hypothetical protein